MRLFSLVIQEEASRVALMMAFPGRIPSGRVISTPVSHMDIFATVLDYFGAAHLDRSDGSSLRRYIDRTSTNAQYDERVAVTELDKRLPVSSVALTGRLGDVPNFAIRKGSYKLLLPKLETSPVLDMMYDLDADPYVYECTPPNRSLPIGVMKLRSLSHNDPLTFALHICTFVLSIHWRTVTR